MPLSRRHFLSAAAAGTAAAAFPARSYARILGANDRLGVAVIGAGGMGSSHIAALAGQLDSENIEPISVADVWQTRAEEGAANLGGERFSPKAETDYRAVLDDDAVDYVTIATPEHQHLPVLTAALRAGKPAYCEKPLTHTAGEAAEAWAVQKETGLPVQVGVQGTSSDAYSSAAKAIEEGMLGRVVQAQVSYVRRYGEQGPWRDPNLTDDYPQARRPRLARLARPRPGRAVEPAPLLRVAVLFGLLRRRGDGFIHPPAHPDSGRVRADVPGPRRRDGRRPPVARRARPAGQLRDDPGLSRPGCPPRTG